MKHLHWFTQDHIPSFWNVSADIAVASIPVSSLNVTSVWFNSTIVCSHLIQSQPKHPWFKKSCSQEFKKDHAEKDVKSKWVAKASCC